MELVRAGIIAGTVRKQKVRIGGRERWIFY
jgi:hypothetical protein